uniref:Uncharacterized protein n=1 Tax=Euplotes crassus TaxID=5936 RepID=A0A7S3KPW2_EUPCR|mmetsp:Transcript_33638/g.33103  ORF Transcript_33638/g.33103 Transcript_33638/m.33103 type:complete len:394 (+) Transcript_33638:716-1897(+)|eukprot:CAMPEP_0197003278 /NCGR_PEP_ID=MMETSP1380-20130617/7589_1 /TAXON_ID=5936 /ORGANISM="Euplotes crassus, Strain CT5" /LENGTH=393 /DNA_ID=CAMNT_0042421735 /DNA_START=1361 /DNA_END=2542 /DNA_ORIENTATION=+
MYLALDINTQDITEAQFTQNLTQILKLINKYYDLLAESFSPFLKTSILCIFNMIATIAANLNSISPAVSTQIEIFYEKLQETDYIDTDNFDKFAEYYGTRDALVHFRAEFLPLDDHEKNEALYYHPEYEHNNQYLVYLTLKQKDQDSQQVILKEYQKYQDEKIVKIMAHKRIAKRIQRIAANFISARKNFNEFKSYFKLTPSMVNWSLNSKNVKTLFKILTNKGAHLREILKTTETTMNLLYNIFNSNYAINNSFDTHFVSGHLTSINDLLESTLEQIDSRISESEESKNDESFNPFVEVSATNEKTGLVDLGTEELVDSLNEIMAPLSELTQSVYSDLQDWLTKKHSRPVFILNLEAQQQNLKQKLKWEQKYNSREKLHKLKKILKQARHRR